MVSGHFSYFINEFYLFEMGMSMSAPTLPPDYMKKKKYQAAKTQCSQPQKIVSVLSLQEQNLEPD